MRETAPHWGALTRAKVRRIAARMDQLMARWQPRLDSIDAAEARRSARAVPLAVG